MMASVGYFTVNCALSPQKETWRFQQEHVLQQAFFSAWQP